MKKIKNIIDGENMSFNKVTKSIYFSRHPSFITCRKNSSWHKAYQKGLLPKNAELRLVKHNADGILKKQMSMEKLDKINLFTGDNDFSDMKNKLNSNGIELNIFSVQNSKKLAKNCNSFHRL